MAKITYRSNLDRDLTPNEVDANFKSLNDAKAETTVTDQLASDVALLETAQAQLEQELATQGAAIAAIESDVTGLTSRMDSAESNITDLETQADATDQALQAHLAATDPHPQYISVTEGDARYDTKGSAATAQANANAISIDGLPAIMDGGLDGYVLKISGTPGSEQVVAVPASSITTPTQLAKRWFSNNTELIGSTSYYLGTEAEPTGTSITKTNTVDTANTENLIAEFASIAMTNIAIADPGLWSFKVWDRATHTDAELRIKIFILDETTFVRTQIGSTHTFPLDNTVDELDTYELTVADAVEVAPGQRLLFSLYSYSASDGRTVTVSFGGAGRQSYLELPMVATHNSLAGLQGGSGTERYHLTSLEHSRLQSFVTTGVTAVDVFTTSGTFLKRPGAKAYHVSLIAAGGGGASGSAGSASGTVIGGGGGAGGARVEVTLDAAIFPDSCAVIVGVGGLGGAYSSGSSGTRIGTDGGMTSIEVNGVFFTAAGGMGSVSSVGPYGPIGLFNGGSGGAGGTSSTPGMGKAGGNAPGAPGGGGGGGIYSGMDWNGGAAERSTVYGGVESQSSGTGGVAPGGDGMDAPTHPVYSKYKYPGISGGGGASSLTSDGGDGGDGGNYGAGGGGGGSTVTGFRYGSGGNGGDGVAVITTYF